MDRRTFLKASTAVAAVGTSVTAATTAKAEHAAPADLPAPAIVAKIHELRVAMSWPDTVSGPADQARRLTTAITSATGGRYRFHLEPTLDSASNAPTETDADMFHGLMPGGDHHHPALAYFTGLPGSKGLNPLQLESWLMVGGGQDLWDGLAAQNEFKPLLCGHLGTAPGIWSRRPLTTLTDLKKRRVLIPGLGAQVMRALGAIPVKYPAAQLADALSQSRVDAIEWGGLQTAMTAKLHKAAKHVTTLGVNANGLAITLGVSKKLWESMNQADQAIISASASHAYRVSLAENDALENHLVQALRDHHGVTRHALDSDAAATLARIADTIIAHTAATDDQATRINMSYMAFKHSASGDTSNLTG